jgi:uncharacterized protein (DUF433 family)
MALTFESLTYPLRALPDGTVRVATTRVTLDTIVHAFKAGATAEAIVLSYPAVKLADIYAVLTYYLRHQEEVDAYLLQRHDEAETLRQEIEQHVDPAGMRERLLARR